MTMPDTESLRLAVALGVFGGGFAALVLAGSRFRSWLSQRTARRFDVLIALLVGLMVGLNAMKLWTERETHVTAAFHRQFHDNWWAQTFRNTHWLGVPLLKNPLDMWVYQELIFETRPDVIVETGTWQGGSARYFASMFDLLESDGRILTIDIEKFPTPENPRATYLIGSSTSPEIVSQVRAAIAPGEKVMVVLDSDHSREHVLKEMKIYGEMVSVGQYMVVEDTHLNGNPVQLGAGDPMAAVLEFLAEDDRFEPDFAREKYGFTLNPRGWLRRVR